MLLHSLKINLIIFGYEMSSGKGSGGTNLDDEGGLNDPSQSEEEQHNADLQTFQGLKTKGRVEGHRSSKQLRQEEEAIEFVERVQNFDLRDFKYYRDEHGKAILVRRDAKDVSYSKGEGPESETEEISPLRANPPLSS